MPQNAHAKVLTSGERRSPRRRSEHVAVVIFSLVCLEATSCALVRPSDEKSESATRTAHVLRRASWLHQPCSSKSNLLVCPQTKPPSCSPTMSPHSISPTDLCSARDAHPLRRAQGATFCVRNTVRQRALDSGQTHCACVLGMMSEYFMREGSLPCGRCGARRGLGVRCCERNQSRHVPLAATACHVCGELKDRSHSAMFTPQTLAGRFP